MTAAGKELIDSFQELPDQEKREVFADILRIFRELESPPMSEDELSSAADELLVIYDREESERGLEGHLFAFR